MSHSATEVVDLAAEARSILSCPAEAAMTVEGVDTPLADGAQLAAHEDGRPTLACRPDDSLVEAALRNATARLTLRSGLVDRRSAPTWLILTGRLAARGSFDCDCCGDVREQIDLDPTAVVLLRPGPDGRSERVGVPVATFRSPVHGLNRGYLRRSVEHVNDAHQRELRLAVAALAGLQTQDVAGVALRALQPDGVTVGWITLDGADERILRFNRPARTVTELGELLRHHLHHGLC